VNHTVYIVDDDDAVRDSLRSVLESQLYEVEDFPSGAAFLQGYGTRQSDCIILDVNLPEIDGIEVLNRLRCSGDSTPVIVISGRPDSRMRERAVEAGAAAFLEKPFAGEELLSVVGKAVRR
jgi:FixJ family two-component response regulator